MKWRVLGVAVAMLALAMSGAQTATGATASEKDVIVGFELASGADEQALVQA